MKIVFLSLLFVLSFVHADASNNTTFSWDPASWHQAKKGVILSFGPTIAHDLFHPPMPHPQLGSLAWEDGLWISRDGLSLYAIYLPFDSLSMILQQQTPLTWYQYIRGDDLLIGQDFSNPLTPTYTTPWVHADIVQSHRSSTAENFTSWSLSASSGKYYNHGAPCGILSPTNSSEFKLMAITWDGPPDSNTKIMLLPRNVSLGLSPLQWNISGNVDISQYREDNPHIEYPYPRFASQTIVLFFESGTIPGGAGNLDIWYSTSENDGLTWNSPLPVTTINTATYNEQQPHLYRNDTDQYWWLYFTVEEPTTGVLSIYRSRGPSAIENGTAISWDAWSPKELVLTCSGTCVGVGEPTLTQAGDLSFVVVARNDINGSQFDRFDADPWIATTAIIRPATSSSSTAASASSGPGPAISSSSTGSVTSSSTGESNHATMIDVSSSFLFIITLSVLLTSLTGRLG